MLLQLVKQASRSASEVVSFASGDADADDAGRAETLVSQLEAAAAGGGEAGPSADAVGAALRSGFWRLRLVSDAQTAAGGLTGYGLAPFCRVLGSFQV